MENSPSSNLRENSETLKETAERYINFINRIGKGDTFYQQETAAALIAEKCKKILNGQLFTQNREAFVADLLAVHQNQGAWQIYPQDIIIDSSQNTVVLRIFIEMEAFGTYTAIVILRYDSNHLITEINEVLNQIKGCYDFKK